MNCLLKYLSWLFLLIKSVCRHRKKYHICLSNTFQDLSTAAQTTGNSCQWFRAAGCHWWNSSSAGIKHWHLKLIIWYTGKLTIPLAHSVTTSHIFTEGFSNFMFMFTTFTGHVGQIRLSWIESMYVYNWIILFIFYGHTKIC